MCKSCRGTLTTGVVWGVLCLADCTKTELREYVERERRSRDLVPWLVYLGAGAHFGWASAIAYEQ